jgi:hypothetical protein
LLGFVARIEKLPFPLDAMVREKHAGNRVPHLHHGVVGGIRTSFLRLPFVSYRHGDLHSLVLNSVTEYKHLVHDRSIVPRQQAFANGRHPALESARRWMDKSAIGYLRSLNGRHFERSKTMALPRLRLRSVSPRRLDAQEWRPL